MAGPLTLQFVCLSLIYYFFFPLNPAIINTVEISYTHFFLAAVMFDGCIKIFEIVAANNAMHLSRAALPLLKQRSSRVLQDAKGK